MVGLVSSNRVKPGERSEVKVTLDPSGKVGPSTKKVMIITNDSTQPTATALVKGDVDHSLDLRDGEPIEAMLFGKTECARCHVDGASELSGVPLYRAVCKMCHGEIGEYASTLSEANRNLEVLRSWVADGKGERGMPGYSADKGGPLNGAQIDSLVESLLSAQKAQR